MKKTKHKGQLLLFLLLLSVSGIFAQTVNVTGVIKGADDKQPIPGVVIKIEGTDVGVTTDLDGKYKIVAPSSSSKLVFSYVGMQTQTVVVGNGGEINITMQIGVMKEVT